MANLSRKIKVLIADDSAFMRKVLSDIINSDGSLEVVGIARNGQDAYEKTLVLKPDVITLDVEMPIMNGLEALTKIMEHQPTPVIMLSAYTQAGAADTIYALEKGAVDFITKPGGTISPDTKKLANEIINKIKTAAGIAVEKIIKQPLSPISQIKIIKQDIAPEIKTQPKQEGTTIVAVGASTGGPKALHEVMSHITRNPNSIIFIVQHMPSGFTKSLAQRLDGVSSYEVKEAEHGEEVKNGIAYVAPGDYHMEVVYRASKLTIQLNQAPPLNGLRPAVDIMMKSISVIPLPKVGVILTGMGNDGTEGLKHMKTAGAVVIGESAETCVVYGMPKAAYQAGVVDYQVPLDKISEYIELAVNKKIH